MFKSIRYKMLALQGGAMLVVALIAGIGLASAWNQLHVYQDLISHEGENRKQILTMVADFKKQVQEWKNVLLRGHDPARHEKYWGKFEKQERTVRERGQALRDALASVEGRTLAPEEQSAIAKLHAFMKAHAEMGEAYRKGRAAYIETGFDPKVGDKAVAGIDRAPTKLLDEAAAEIDGLMDSEAARAAEATQQLIVVVGVGLLLGIAGTLALLSLLSERLLIRPVNRISEAFARYGEGDFSVEIPVEGKDEIGRLAENGRRLRQNLGDILATLGEATGRLSEVVHRVQQTQHEAMQAAGDQRSQAEAAATAVTEMTSSAQEIARAADQARQSADGASHKAREGYATVNRNSETVDVLATEVTRASEVINTVDENSKSIGGILDVIRGIAEQTNLLALNAAIEAARAGEQGRGFAVVADEVRTLASRSQEATEEIQATIEKLQVGARDAVQVMENSRAQAHGGVEQARETGGSLEAIESCITEINGMNAQIATAAEQQSLAAEQINQSVVAASSAAERMYEVVQHNSALGEEVATLSEQLRDIAARFRF